MHTPGFPKAPHTTPSSTHAHHPGLFNPKRPRPPVHNPFDKFSQQDFDAWIGKLTGDLEKALGYEEVTQSQSTFPQAVEQTDDGYDDSDSYVDDSFAEVKARRVVDKGKARDPREGPGLGPKSGDIEQPIEILSDEEIGEGEQSLEFEGSAEGEPDELYEQAEEEDEEDGGERGGEDSDVENDIWSRRRRRIQYAAAGGSTRSPPSDDMERDVESGENGSEQNEEDEEASNEGLVSARSPDGVIQLSSDEEAGTANLRQEEEEEAFLSEEDAEGVASSPAPVLEQGNEPKFQDEEDMQPSDEDTSFPPHPTSTPGDIRDPWAQVAQYAEDYYAGGEVVPDSRSRLSPHHLGINDDDAGFLTPDVVNPDLDMKEEEEGEEGEDEFEDESAKDDLEDTETQELEPEPDENDHLFNRLRSYTQPKPVVYSAWRGPRTNFIVMGPGSNEEPILIDSDEEPEEQNVTVEQHPKASSSDGVVRPFEEAIVAHDGERFSEVCDQSIAIDAPIELQVNEQIQQSTDEQVQPSTEATGHLLEAPSPRDPPESSIVHKIVRADADTINDMSYVNLDDAKAAQIDSDLYAHGSIDTSSPLSHSKNLESTSGLQCESTTTGDSEEQALDQMAAQAEAESRVTALPSTELYVSGQNTVYEKVDEEMDEMDELDELDELDDAGPWPLMTSDLDYPLGSETAEVDDESARDSIDPSETVETNGNTFPSQALEVEDAENEIFSGIHIFVEEADKSEPGLSFEPITINVQAPTPLIMPELDFEGSPTSADETVSPDDVRNAIISGSTPPVAQSVTEEFVLKEETTRRSDDIGSNDNQKSVFVEETIKLEEVAEGVEEVGIAGAVPGEPKFMYVVQEPTSGPKLDDLAEYDRGISVDIASVPSDDIISTVEAGHVEDVPPDTELEETKNVGCSEAEAEGTRVEDVQSYSEVSEDAKVSNIEVAAFSIATEVPIVSCAAPEAVDEDYFARPCTPILPPTHFDILGHTSTPSGNLPSIIQLPGTPQKVLSPGSTPAPGPTPVSIAIEAGVLKVLKENPGLFSATSTPTFQQPRRNSGAEITPSETKFSNIENTIAQQTSPFKASNSTYPESSKQVRSDLPTFLPVTTTVKPVLYVDPYPYSLSTPLPYSQQEEDASEDATDQDNSFSSPSLNENELDGTTVNNAVASKSPGPGEETSKVMVETPIAQLYYAKLQQDTVDVEAETDALIDEFLVDEPESDTDADGEADPEFTVQDSSVSARTSEGIKDKESEGHVLPVVSMSEGSGAAAKEVGPQEETKDEAGALKVKEGTRMELDELEDPFKVMGNDSLIAPGEAPDVESIEESGEEETEKTIQEAGEIEPLDSQTAPTSELPVEVPSVESVPVSPPSQVPPLRDASPGESLSASTRECMKSNHSPLQTHVAQHDSPSEVNTGPTDSAQGKEEISSPASERTEIAQPRSLVTLPRIKTQGVPLAAQESRTKGSPRRVHVSLEDPYHADNDSDREQGSNAGKTGKRKRSLSEVSNDESLSGPRSASVAKGKGKVSRQSIKVPSRPRKKPSLFSSSVTSRSPSVASTVVSDGSSLLSPSYLSLSSSDPRPFIHAHSRRKLGNAPTTVQQQRHKQLQKVVPGSRSQDGVLRAENVLTKAPSGSSALGSSPMTRSHCRYHKISIPKTEDGPRIHFLVPGCSLNDAELIEEEEIEDHGEAIIRGDTLIADKIETINFEPYLLWAMRQLVGTELLRENEVYYLPEPNETIVRSTQEPKKKGGRPSKQRSKGADENIANPSRKPAPRSLPSDVSSVGSAASVSRQVTGGLDDDDMSSITETEEEDISSSRPQEKEVRQNPPKDLDVSSSKGETSISRKRGRRLGQDAAAYYPSTDGESGSDFGDHNTGRKSARSRGVKRPRASESNVAGADGRKPKKAKRQSSLNRSESHSEASQLALQRSPSHLDHLTEIQPTSSEAVTNAA